MLSYAELSFVTQVYSGVRFFLGNFTDRRYRLDYKIICYEKIIYENNRDRPGVLYRGGGGVLSSSTCAYTTWVKIEFIPKLNIII